MGPATKPGAATKTGVGRAIPRDPRGAPFLIEHADRLWRAEEANSARFAARSNLVLSVITAFIGVQLFLFERVVDNVVGSTSAWWPLRCGFWSAAAASPIVLVIALFQVLGPWRFGKKSGETSSASSSMALPESITSRPWDIVESEAAWLVFKMTHNSANDLAERNAKRASAISRAQWMLLLSLLLLLVTMGSYALLEWSVPSRNGTP